MQNLALYIHIPFCNHICPYCDFATVLNHQDKNHERYIIKIIEELTSHKTYGFDQSMKVNSIYFGGGTPSVLDAKHLEMILKQIPFKQISNCEITIEVNPEDVNEQILKKWKNLGINRISLGVQSLTNEHLIKLERAYTTNRALHALDLTRSMFENVSVDLMYALPSQNMHDLEKCLKLIGQHEPSHVSTYNLAIEKNTRFFKLGHELNLPHEDLQRDMYLLIKQFMEDHGFIHYEISNYAKRGFQSKHNQAYWEQKPYWGVGLGAHSFDPSRNLRWHQTRLMSKYLGEIAATDLVSKEHLTHEQTWIEHLLSQLRQIKGLNLSQTRTLFPKEYLKSQDQFVSLKQLNLIDIHNDTLSLTPQGLVLSNYVLEKLV